MHNSLREFKTVFLFLCLWVQPLWAAVPVTWLPETRVAVVNMEAGGAEGRGMLESFRSMGPALGLPEGYFALIVPAGEAARGRDGEIRRTSLYLGEQSTENVTELIEPLIAAGVPLKTMKGMLLVTCYGGRTLSDGTPSLAKRMAQAFSFPVLATTGELTQVIALELDVHSKKVEPHGLAYSAFAPAGSTRVSPWTIETPAAVTSEQVDVLKKTQAVLEEMQRAASALGLLPGDLRPRSVPTISAPYPNVVGIAGNRRIEKAARKEWERFNLRLEDRQIAAMVINPLMPEIQLAHLEYGVQLISQALASGNGIVVPVLSRWWFARQRSIPQYIADTSRLIVFHPKVPENATTLSDEEFLNAVDYKNWVALRPALTRLPYFDDEVEAVKAELAKSLGENQVRPFSKVEWAGCQDGILGAPLTMLRKLFSWSFLRKKS